MEVQKNEIYEQLQCLWQMIDSIKRTNRNLGENSPIKASNLRTLATLESERLELDRRYEAMKSPAYGLEVAAKRAVEIATISKEDLSGVLQEVTRKSPTKQPADIRATVLEAIIAAEEEAAVAIAKVALLRSQL